jgi:ABC-type antimicrobial peptide transport system permease subunit
MFRQHIKTAFRNLWKNKVFTAINFVGLILGLSAIMVLSVMVYQFLTFDSIHTNKSRMAYLKTKSKDGHEYAQTTFPLLYEAFLAIFIGCIGMLGLITVFARQRVKEIGVRKVLGANAPDIIRLLSKNFLLMGCWQPSLRPRWPGWS